MDASASPKPDADNVYGFFLKINENNYPTPLQVKNTVIKYTKLPDFEYDKVKWPTPHSYSLQPRLRRIITLDDDDLKTNRSLRSNFAGRPKVMAASNTKRKIVTISEDDEYSLHPRFFQVKNRKASPAKMSNRTIESEYKSEKQSSNRITSRLTSSAKYTKETKTSAKTNSTYNKKEVNLSQQNYRGKQIQCHRCVSPDSVRTGNVKEKVSLRNTKSANLSRNSISKNFDPQSESDKTLTKIKNILYENLKTNVTYKKSTEKPSTNRPAPPQSKNKLRLKEIPLLNKAPKVIRVPLDDGYKMPKVTELRSDDTLKEYKETVHKTDRSCYTDEIILLKHVNVGTDPSQSVDQVTDMNDFEIGTVCKTESTVQTETIKEIFDSLEIPNVTLTKDKSEPKEENVDVHCSSLPNLKVPPFNISPRKEDVSSHDMSFCQSASYIFSRATLTYTTRQKINFHVVGNDEEVSPNPPSPLDYPVSVMSVFKNELKNKHDNVSSDDTCKNKNNTRGEYINCINELNSLNCSYVCNKLMKPSDIISTIRVNNDLLQNDYICEQFQRELNFIDSFFESLQYLESCSLSEKCFTDTKVDSLVDNSALFDSTFDVKNSEYDNFLSKLENGANINDTETMASKSLCLLNLLIRDEQRRAKNLLFVLKMREDALKDFTKSQILWLEKKKKHDNTDISTLKKKQRGALLKLQHECGEMQRMRKALVALSEKRKVALIKTKKNIELKLKNNVDVEQIILGKKKLKRTASGDRNVSPLKCFDLSSSGCEESTPSRQNSDVAYVTPEIDPRMKVSSAEKCVQTGDAPSTNLTARNSDVTAENFVAVDGGYLNILFHDLALPQIFSSGKEYEVNEEELKNIVSSTTNHYTNMSGSEVVEKFMDQLKTRDVDTSSPSTAHSLVEEFDQYYRGLAEEGKSSAPHSPEHERECSISEKVLEVTDSSAQLNQNLESPKGLSYQTTVTSTNSDDIILMNDSNLSDGTKSCLCDDSMISVDKQCVPGKDLETYTSQTTGPLPVPVGAAAAVDSPPPDASAWVPPPKSTASSTSASDTDIESVSSQPQNASSSSIHSTPAQCEAEELRRQQLAIEREIKALEQQQCRLLVVREIPDKPPPPYTPPTETKPKPPRMFALDDASESKIEKLLSGTLTQPSESKEPFDLFLEDYCLESLERHTQELSDKPWDACCLLPQKPQVEKQDLIQNTTTEIKEVLTSVTPTVVSGVSSRRSDHIDDILFTEWRRCEPEWTALHTDEAIVKNQLFESIFQKILTETIDEYKKTVTPTEINLDIQNE